MPRQPLPVALLLLLAAPAAAQVPADKALATMQPGDGLQVELFAAEPMLFNPTAMDVDHIGRVWVTEAVNYRCFLRKKPLNRDAGDRVVILTDKNGDGKADDSTVFYQGKELIAPLGIAVVKEATGPSYKVFVCQSPDILLFQDKDGDGKADGPPEKFLTGFGGFDHDHGVHSVLIGPDGKLYFTVGDQGVNGLQGRDGKGRKWTTKAGSDCQAGTVWRCDLDGGNLELIAHNFRNNYECCVDSFGEIWLSDNDDDGNQQTRICHVLPGGNYGYWPRGAGQTHWHEEQPGVVHKTLRTGFGSPTGITFYEGSLLPEKYRGHLLHTDAGPRELRCFHRKPKGAGYELDKTLMLTSTDNWFRPSDVCVAPDGSVFVCDWYDPGVGGHGMGDTTRGRVYRLTPKGHSGYKVPAVKLDTKEGVLAALGSSNLAVRATAMDRLTNDPTTDMLLALADGVLIKDNAQATRAAWAFMIAGVRSKGKKLPAQPSEDEARRFAAAMIEFGKKQSSEPAMKCAVLRMQYLLGFTPADPRPDNAKWIEDASASLAVIGREFLVLSRNAPAENLKPLFYGLAKGYDGQDHFYRAALNIACGTDPARRDAILADFDKHFPEWNDKVADLVWELRPKSVLPRLEKLLADPKLTAAQRARVVDILAANDDPAAGKSVLALLTADHPAEVRARAIDNLKLFLPTKWKGVAQGDEIKAAVAQLLGNTDPAVKIAGLRLVAAANHTAAIDAVADVWNRTDRPDVKAEVARTLGGLHTVKAVETLRGMVLGSAWFGGDPVRVVEALGEQITGRGESPPAKLALATLQELVADPKADNPKLIDIRRAAVAALAGTRAGTGWLLKLQEDGKLPAALAADAGRLLRNSPFQGERNKALLLFPAPSKLDLAKLPPLSELAKRQGDPANGQRLMANSLTGEAQCLKCHMVRGVGGLIGPDLSMVGKKASRENLFESIVQPSKAISHQYDNWRIDTEDGQSITGLIVGDTETTLTVRDANGKDHPFPAKEVTRRKLPLSLMPDNTAAALTEDELVDVVEYLTRLQTPAYTPEAWQVAGPFPAGSMAAGLDKAFPPEAAGATGITWKPTRPAGTGYVDLAALHGPAAANAVSYARTVIDSPADQEATVLLGTDDGGKLWVNGREAWKSTATRPAAPEQDRVAVKLTKGPNVLLLKVANGNNPHGFYLTVLSGQELKAGK